MCDWNGSAHSASQNGFDIKIENEYKTLCAMIYHKIWNGGATYFVGQSLSSDDEFGWNEDYSPCIDNMECKFQNEYGTWKDPKRIHAFLYVYSPLCYID